MLPFLHQPKAAGNGKTQLSVSWVLPVALHFAKPLAQETDPQHTLPRTQPGTGAAQGDAPGTTLNLPGQQSPGNTE